MSATAFPEGATPEAPDQHSMSATAFPEGATPEAPDQHSMSATAFPEGATPEAPEHHSTTAPRPAGSGLRMLGVEIGEGLRAIIREPVALFFSVVMPVGFYVLFAGL